MDYGECEAGLTFMWLTSSGCQWRPYLFLPSGLGCIWPGFLEWKIVRKYKTEILEGIGGAVFLGMELCFLEMGGS